MSVEYKHTPGLRLSFTPAEFAELNRQARKHNKPVREFIEYMARCYLQVVKQGQAK